MAGSLYSITECFALAVNSDDPSNEPPNSTKQTITVQAGDSLVVCTDGIHDLVPSSEWALIKSQTDLQGIKCMTQMAMLMTMVLRLWYGLIKFFTIVHF